MVVYVVQWPDLSGCSLSSLHCTLHIAAPLCGRLCAGKVQPAKRLPQHPAHGRGQTMRGSSTVIITVEREIYLPNCVRIPGGK